MEGLCNEDFVPVVFRYGFSIFFPKKDAARFFGRRFVLLAEFLPVAPNAAVTFISMSFADRLASVVQYRGCLDYGGVFIGKEKQL